MQDQNLEIGRQRRVNRDDEGIGAGVWQFGERIERIDIIQIVTGAAGHRVGPRLADQGIVPGRARQSIAAGHAHQNVVAAIAIQGRPGRRIGEYRAAARIAGADRRCSLKD